MLPMIITLIFINFLLDSTSSSPVYNMQPALITTNIGTTGRNIRNLPCISRRNNQSGICMFAIDCLKANGTHLGTCIDRFYFGSCCHIQQVQEIMDNNIDSSIFPERKPPLRLSTTQRPLSSTPLSTTVLETKETKLMTTVTTNKPITTTKNITSDATTKTVSKYTTKSPSTTETPRVTTVTTTQKPVVVTEMSQKLSTFQSVENFINDVTSVRPTINVLNYTKDNFVNSDKTSTTSIPAVSSSEFAALLASTTKKPTSNVTLNNQTTIKPIKVSTSIPKPATSKPSISKPTRTTIRPNISNKPTRKPTQKPIYPKPTTLLKPITRPTHRPSLSTRQPTKPSRTTTKRPFTTKSPAIKPTKEPSTIIKNVTIASSSSTTDASTQFTTIPHRLESTTQTYKNLTESTETVTKISTLVNLILSDESTNAPIINKTQISTKDPIELALESMLTTLPSTSTEFQNRNDTSTKIPEKLSTTESNEVFIPMNISANLSDVNGNVISNEIESITPLVGLTNKPIASTTISFNTTDEDWVPITTSDTWILLPSVSSDINNITAVSPNYATSTEAVPNLTNSSTPTNSSTSTKKPETTFMSTPTTEISTNDSNNILSVTDSLETTSLQVDINISDNYTELSENSANMSDFTDVCGRRMHPEARIVGGEKSFFGKWPWQISLRQWRTSTYLHKCGAALLNENWAITAAHCVDSVPPSDLLLRLGEHDLSTELEPYLHQERRVQIVASHPQFDPRTFEYDLALLRFYEPVKFQPNILPVCVPQSDDNFIGRTAYVTGWGRLYEDGPLPSILQEVSVPVINNTLCESMYRSAGYIEHIPHIFICAGWRRGGFDSCEGDSGGPMVIQRDDRRFLLAGVISWGIGCAEPNQPGVYTRISEFRDWINQILQF